MDSGQRDLFGAPPRSPRSTRHEEIGRAVVALLADFAAPDAADLVERHTTAADAVEHLRSALEEFHRPIPGDGAARLDSARAYVEANRREGVTCPCCGQLAKTYARQVNGAMARALIWLARVRQVPGQPGHLLGGRGLGDTWSAQPGPWVPLEAFPLIQNRRAGGDFAKLALWGLIEERPPVGDAKRSGEWRITRSGFSWASGSSSVPRYALIFDSQCLGLEGEPWTVRDALGKCFDFDELWRA